MGFWNRKRQSEAKTSANLHRPMTFKEVMEDPEARRQFRLEIEKAAAEKGDKDLYTNLEHMTPDEITDKVVREIRSNHLPVPVTRAMVKTQVLWFLEQWKDSDEYKEEQAKRTTDSAEQN